RHLDGVTLRRLEGGGDLGPRTEVVGEDRVRLEYDPTHPDADENGYVHYPDVNVVEEMAHLISANRVYEANLSTVQAAKEMIKRTLEI
ncbi:MAG: flagellar basal body rod C-terminal domain-containing protein, partial [Rhodothermales bacterium]|nr:flagellar basal body rod C-terminal domain-containing protein [Rhodothermales bacterium]